jgi:CheY-like chemotaxis protein
MKKMQVVREHMPYGKVLVVDDMETNLYVARGFLLPYGLTVETVLSGKAAIKKIESGNIYDIIFMDHMMPEMDGIETARTIRSKGYTYPIVALTANAVAGQSDMFMANGFNGFISKPIDIRELNASLNKHVRIKQQPAKVIEMPRVGPELIKIFTYDAEKAIAVLQEYEARKSYESDDLQMYIINVHALKSALANVGETELSAFAKELEFAGKEKSIEFISKKTYKKQKKLQALVSNFKESAKENSAGEISSEDMDYLQQKLHSVKESCAAYDVNAATFALKELRHKTWPSAYVELFDAIDEHLLCSNFDEAAALCDAEVNKP